MRRIYILIMCMCMAKLVGYAQGKIIEDKELASLVEVVKLLRNPNETNYNQAKLLLKADEKWTPMNETGKLQVTECKPSEKTPSFKLNRLLTSVGKERKYVTTTGNMLNGEDERYHYSLYERSLKKGKAATYKLNKRYGQQTFLLVPFKKKKGSLSVLVDGKKPSTIEGEDGTIMFTFNHTTEKEISLKVSNESGNALSFVILNHNSWKK